MKSLDKKTFDERVSALVGQTVRGVTYWEIAYEGGEPMWRSELADVDGLDFGVDLHFDDGAKVALTWGSEFYSYGISVQHGASAGNESARSWDATERWRSFVGATITGASVQWTWVEDVGGQGRRIVLPQDVRLDFDGVGAVFLSALERRDGLILPLADNVLVVFGEETARGLKIWPPPS